MFTLFYFTTSLLLIRICNFILRKLPPYSKQCMTLFRQISVCYKVQRVRIKIQTALIPCLVNYYTDQSLFPVHWTSWGKQCFLSKTHQPQWCQQRSATEGLSSLWQSKCTASHGETTVCHIHSLLPILQLTDSFSQCWICTVFIAMHIAFSFLFRFLFFGMFLFYVHYVQSWGLNVALLRTNFHRDK